jgi:hypothetical protein
MISDKQRELLLLIKDGGFIHGHHTPGIIDAPEEYYLMKKGDHRDLDGRTVVSLERRGFITYCGDGDYQISESGKKIIQRVASW